MDWNIVYGLVDARLLIVVAACWVIGFILKKTPRVADWTIVYIVTVVAMVFAVGLIGFSVEAVIQGILSGAFAVYGHQIIKQTKQGDTDDSR
ncbi:MAG TPA: phage holin family protein [Candidatus Paenibacillus intestinavium]|nr:phage holin family protein [Candidatus Paenibacillus intestinavium]